MALPAFSTWDRNHFKLRTMAFMALLEHDLKVVIRSWVTRIWVILTALQALVLTIIAIYDQEETLASEALSALLGTYPVLWSTFVILISAGAVASESGVVADSILSKAVTRYDYIFAKLGARLAGVLAAYLIVTLPAAYMIGRGDGSDMTTTGIVWGIVLVGMILVLIASLAVTFSTLFDRTLVAIVVTWVLWYAAGGIFGVLEIEHLSPLHVVDNLPAILQGTFRGSDQWRILGLFGTASLVTITGAAAYFARKDL